MVLKIENVVHQVLQSRLGTLKQCPILCETEKVIDVDSVEFVVFVHL